MIESSAAALLIKCIRMSKVMGQETVRFSIGLRVSCGS